MGLHKEDKDDAVSGPSVCSGTRFVILFRGGIGIHRETFPASRVDKPGKLKKKRFDLPERDGWMDGMGTFFLK